MQGRVWVVDALITTAAHFHECGELTKLWYVLLVNNSKTCAEPVIIEGRCERKEGSISIFAFAPRRCVHMDQQAYKILATAAAILTHNTQHAGFGRTTMP